MPRSTAWVAYASIGTSLSGDRSVCRWASRGRSRACRSTSVMERPPAERSSPDDTQLVADRRECLERPIELLARVRGRDDRADAGEVEGDRQEHDGLGEDALAHE